MQKYILDTNLIIDYLRQQENSFSFENFVAQEKPSLYFSAVVAAELLSGTRSSADAKAIHELLNPFEKIGRIVTPTYNNWKKSGEVLSILRKKHHLDIHKAREIKNDILIALSAREIGATVVTRNKKDFQIIDKAADIHFIPIE